MSTIIEKITGTPVAALVTPTAAVGSARWLAPELISSITAPTYQCDTYSFAMAMLELLTGEQPYPNHKRDAAVIRDVVERKRTPSRPVGVIWLSDDDLWTMMLECWSFNATDRPAMGAVTRRIESGLAGSVNKH
jgi:serine/threonine protein kinase